VLADHKMLEVLEAILKVEQPMDQHCKVARQVLPEIKVVAVVAVVATGVAAQVGMAIVQQVILVVVAVLGITTRRRLPARH
jgi:type IV secretory pathway VirB2 component (pilin)